MEQNEQQKYAREMIKLIRCAVSGTVPEKYTISALDLSKLYSISHFHNLTAITAFALESCGIKEDKFSQAKEKAIRKNILLETERKRLSAILDRENIWYMPLKGAILKDWYPKTGMRQMSDNDILIDPDAKEKVKQIMLDSGFRLKGSQANVDEFSKEPVYNFEMHTELFMEYATFPTFYGYFKTTKERLVKDNDSTCGYHFKNEDFYLYMVAHEYKHFEGGGTGVRSLLDAYIFLKKVGDELDWSYIKDELKKLDMQEFEEKNRKLAMKVFDSQPLTSEEESFLDYYISSGTYGSPLITVGNRIQKYNVNSKKLYLLKRIFPPMEHYRCYFPWAYKCKVLLPAAWGYRLVRGVFKKQDCIKSEMKAVNKKF